jgi:drug/metabolite transporter (DMT)-like permease
MPPKSDALSDTRGALLMLASVLLFTVNILAIRAVALLVPAADGWLASLFRGALGMIVVLALHGWGRGLQPRRLLANRLVVLRGVVGGISIIVFYITVVKLGAARAVILNLTYPVFATIIAALWLKEKPGRASVAWMLAGLGGLAVFLSEDGRLLHPSPYDLLGLLGAVMAGWVVVVIRRLRHEEHPATIYAAQAVFSFVLAAPAAAKLPALPPAGWIGLSLAAIVVTQAQLVMTRAYQTMTVARGSSMQMLLPLATGIGGYFCFGEKFHPLELAGAGLTLVATLQVVRCR